MPPCRDETPTPNPDLPDVSPTPSGLTVGYYNKSGTPYYCPIVKKAVEKAIKENPGIGAGLVRLFFHDCFVRVRIRT